jgi:hypothetical protein
MISNNRERLIFHGAIVMLGGLLFGFMSVVGLLDEAFCSWRISLITTGIWLLATAVLSN